MSKIFYRYMRANLETLMLLYDDALHFSTPDFFNDPFDSNPTLELDVDTEVLAKIHKELLAKLIMAECSSTSLKEAFTEMGDGQLLKVVENKFIRDLNSAYEEFQAHVEISFFDEEAGRSKEEYRRLCLKCEIEEALFKRTQKGVCCFSEFNNNSLMWAHYADGHKGICVGYTEDRLPKPNICRVSYDAERTIKASLVAQAILNKSKEASDELDKMILLRKAKEWQYEKEWRIIDERGKRPSPLFLKEVIFGEKSCYKFCYLVMQVLSKHKEVEFHKIYKNPASYKLSLRELDPEGDERIFSPREPSKSSEERSLEFDHAIKEREKKKC